MDFKTIFVANLAEVARPLAHLMDRRRRNYEIIEDHSLCDRFIFSGGDGRVLITPFPLDEKFLAESLKILNYRRVINLFPKVVGESLSESILSDKNLLRHIFEIIEGNPNVELISYAATPEILNLIGYLRNRGLKFKTPEIPMDNIWTTSFFDSKAGFRQTVEKLNSHFPSMPEGAICSSPSETVGYGDYLLRSGRDIVIKANQGLAGAGLRIIKRSEIIKDPMKFILSLISRYHYWTDETVVVEEFIEPELNICGGAPNVELRIIDGKSEVLYVCGMRISREGVFQGVELGKKAVPDRLRNIMIRSSGKFGSVLRSFGYRGFFEIDFVHSKSGKIYPIEANLRRTGGTHVYEIGRKLIGRDFLNTHYIVANNMVNTKRFKGKRYEAVKEKTADLLYPIDRKKEGVIITIVNLLKRGDLGYAVLGPNRERVYEIEKEFLAKI